MVYLEDADFTLYCGDALETLRTLPDRSVHMCVTSPPFYGLRDYGTGSWEGGDEGCDHVEQYTNPTQRPASGGVGNTTLERSRELAAQQPNAGGGGRKQFRDICGKCGARRVDQQIGLEETPDEWVARLVEVFREVRRVLRDDGTLWVEIGDSYKSTAPGTNNAPARIVGKGGRDGDAGQARARYRPLLPDLKSKDLIGAPWLLAFALRADGWYLRSDIIWARPNPMPESVRDRPTKSHSYVFLLSKQPRYFFDQEAVRESAVKGDAGAGARNYTGTNGRERLSQTEDERSAGRNVRSVWQIPTEPLPDEHYAAFPQKLVERCILAGTSERGVCPKCGAPWERVVEGRGRGDAFNGEAPDTGRPDGAHRRNPRGGQKEWDSYTPPETTGWRSGCECSPTGVAMWPPIGATVLDPFMGSGTTALVARRLGRRCVGIELSAEYCAIAARRTQQLTLEAVMPPNKEMEPSEAHSHSQESLEC